MAGFSDDRDFFQLNRLKGYNDAVFAIVATILVLPIRKLEQDSGPKETLWNLLETKWEHIIVYLVGFSVICAIWESHVNRFRILSHVDDVLVWLNLTSLLFTCFLPFCVNLEATFHSKHTPIILICCDLMVLELLEVAMIFYSFYHDELLTDEVQELPEVQMRERRNYLFLKKLTNPVLYVLAGGLSMVSTKISWVILVLVIISPCINRLLGFIFRKCMNIYMGGGDFDRIFGNYIETERVELFSDGAFAIVSTLLVLDITAENFPTVDEVNENGIETMLANMWREFLTFCGTFIIVALLWFTHHSLFHYIRNMNQVMLVINNLSLSFMGLTPLLASIMNKFGGEKNESEKLAVRCSAVVIFSASLCQAIIFVIALCKGQTHLLQNASPSSSPRTHNYLAMKMIILPLISALVFNASFAGRSATYVVYFTAVFATPLIFVMLKICFGRGGYDILHLTIEPDFETFAPTTRRPRARISRKDITTNSQPIAV